MYNLEVDVPNVIPMIFGLDIDNSILRSMSTHDYGTYSVTTSSSGHSFGQTRDVADMADGIFENLTPDDMRIKLGRFYGHSAISGDVNSTEVKWSLPYLDSDGMGMMITAAKPIFADGILQGVAGYDITMDYMIESVELQERSDGSYVYLIDGKRGYLLSHPKI